MDTTKKLAIISTCTGIRGLERGIERAIGQELSVAAYVEIETFITANLIAAMETGHLAPSPIWTDLKTFNFEAFRGKVHGIIGGYPCQPFSIAGNRGGQDDPRHLWPFIKDGVREVKPLFCFFENVRGHLSLGFREVKSDLEQLGYRVEAGLFSAEEVGAPHKRERLFILAIMGDTKYNGSFISEVRRRCDKSGNRSEKRTDFTCQSTGTGGREDLSDLQGIEKLANSEGVHAQGFSGGQGKGEFGGSCNESEELANPHSERHAHGRIEIDTAERGKHALSDIATSGGNELANSDSSRSWENSEQSELRTNSPEQSPRHCWFAKQRESREGGFDRWPSRPGQNQYEWEAPRTIESGMGVTVDGYNFREDLLRAGGNGVVEQAAELAFRTLIEKFK